LPATFVPFSVLSHIRPRTIKVASTWRLSLAFFTWQKIPGSPCLHNFNFAFRSVGAWEQGYTKTSNLSLLCIPGDLIFGRNVKLRKSSCCTSGGGFNSSAWKPGKSHQPAFCQSTRITQEGTRELYDSCWWHYLCILVHDYFKTLNPATILGRN